jgi:hypothetical protein
MLNIPATGYWVAISPSSNKVMYTMHPTAVYAIKILAGPASARDFDVPKNRPVPMVPSSRLVNTKTTEFMDGAYRLWRSSELGELIAHDIDFRMFDPRVTTDHF